ncbi:MAG TPA: preprotein translocase subunit SecA [Chloroflexota bacterium]|nr:preprotein translocase subunit SecA [Chloroflexota bacterium]
MFKWLTSLLGAESSEKEIGRLRPRVHEINALEDEFRQLSDDELREITPELKSRLAAGESLDDVLLEAFAAVREAARRTIGLRHHDVQLLAGMVLHEGTIAEMRTGEGKTLVATLPLYLNALTGKGAHLVTPNDYLSRVGGGWNGPAYRALGMSVGVIAHEFSGIYDPTYRDPSPHGDPRLDHWRPVPRAEAYAADITYGTNNEFGFDYLRDNMVWDLSARAQRPLHYAIVDEVDNILIDEARTPLIISGQADPATDKYAQMAGIVPRLQHDIDLKIDLKHRSVTLTEEGIAKMERWLGVENLYDPENFELTHYMEQALKAQFIFQRDRDYVLFLNGQVLEPHQHHPSAEIVIVDEFTGRLMFGRRYSEGLHQAIEAKERVTVQRESMTLATITFQNYFRMYEKLAGMTGTAMTEKEEFQKIYDLDVVAIPTHRPMIRQDAGDLVFKSEEAKFNAVVREIGELHAAGRPVLVGTVSIEKSERLSQLLKRQGVPHQVLNAKYHEQEAMLIAQAGRPGAVTIATNMAGRGVDILLGGNPTGLTEEELRRGRIDAHEQPQEADRLRDELVALTERDKQRVMELGGLHVVGTERHEARRIDNQLRGRAGRQGEPGSSRFYVSLEDDLMKRFGGANIAGIMDRLGLEDDVPIEHGLVTKSIENAQTKVEGYNFDIRKHVVQYDDVMNKQREVIYGERDKVLRNENLRQVVLEMVGRAIDAQVDLFTAAEHAEDWDLEGLVRAASQLFPLPPDTSLEAWENLSKDELREELHALAEEAYEQKEARLGAEAMRQVERAVMLHVVDRLWIDHLTAMDELREGIGLRAYGQRDPLVEYKNEAYNQFQSLLQAIQDEIVQTIYRVELQRVPATPPPAMQAQQAVHPAPQQAVGQATVDEEHMPEAALPTAPAHTNGPAATPVDPKAVFGRAARAPAERAMATNRNAEPARRPAAPARAAKVGRNDPCPCGSGKKYKHCHGR